MGASNGGSSSGAGGGGSTSNGQTFSGNCPTTAFTCSSVTKAVTVTGTTALSSEYDMAQHICSVAPLSIAVATAGWNSYKSGVLSASTCGTSIDHAVVLVGMSQSNNAWVVRNQWGSSWGVSSTGQALDSSSS